MGVDFYSCAKCGDAHSEYYWDDEYDCYQYKCQCGTRYCRECKFYGKYYGRNINDEEESVALRRIKEKINKKTNLNTILAENDEYDVKSVKEKLNEVSCLEELFYTFPHSTKFFYKILEEIGIGKKQYCLLEDDYGDEKEEEECYGNLFECESCTKDPEYMKIDANKLIEWISKKKGLTRKEVVVNFLEDKYPNKIEYPNKMDYFNNWPLWKYLVLKQMDDKGYGVYYYNVDTDEIITEKESQMFEKSPYKKSDTYKIVGLSKTINSVYKDINNKKIPQIPQNIKNIISKNQQNDPFISKLL